MNVLQGQCYVLYTYDVGLAIDLNECDRRITALKQREQIKHKRRAPKSYFDHESPPLRVTKETSIRSVGEFVGLPTLDLVVHDFGAVTVMYGFPLEGDVSKLVRLSSLLSEDEELPLASRREVEFLLVGIGDAVTRPHVADAVEDFMIYEIRALSAPMAPTDIQGDFAMPLAQILRSETGALSEEEVQDALSCRLSFGPADLAIIDWNAAIVFDREADDVRTVLEMANAELLEMRFLDEQLDRALERAYKTLMDERHDRLWKFAGGFRSDLQQVAGLQVDSAVLFERINNALKLFGDQYLARVYRLASQRFHLNDWDASILRKLQTLESIYQKMSDRASNRRMELLEWIIIVLIAVSILLPFFT